MIRRDGARAGEQRSVVGAVGVMQATDHGAAPHQGSADLNVSRPREDQTGAEGERQNRDRQYRLAARRAAGNRSRARPDKYSAAARRWRPGAEVRSVPDRR